MGGCRRIAGRALVAAVAALWSVAATAAGPAWNGQGRVVAVDAAQGTVVLDHGGIPGLLPAAQAQFPVERPELLRGVLPGDRVRFTLVAGDDTHGLLRLASLAAEQEGGGSSWFAFLLGVALALALGALGALLALALALRRSLGVLHRRLAALDQEAGMLRRLGGETQDAVRQIGHALDEIGATVLVAYVRELRRRLPGSGRDLGPPPAPRTASPPPPAVVVVQRGRTEVFRALADGAADTSLQVIWDRRRGERRASRRGAALERRRAERRAAPPETWRLLGFILAAARSEEVPRGSEPRASRPLRAVGGERGSRADTSR
jgi:Cu/Ag efflux protein CusF